jgi:hypothetical protein
MFLLLLNAAVVVVAVSTTSPPDVVWDRRRVEVRQGDSLSVTCTVPRLDLMSVVRIERRDDDKHTRMTLADNDDVKAPFAGHPRYRIVFNQRHGVGTITVNYDSKLEFPHAGQDSSIFQICKQSDENMARKA